MIKKITLHPYNPEWPKMFQAEADQVLEKLGKHCIDIQHIGSTSVPGLTAKEDLDILCVVDQLSASLKLEEIGYILKGELNIPLRYFFSKNTEQSKVNLHVVEPGHGFIGLNLCFRNYLRDHADARDTYGQLKIDILKDPSAYEKSPGGLPRYTFRKNDFIKQTLDKAGYKGSIVNFCAHDQEWDAAKLFRQKYFFDKVPIKDPYTWTFDHPNHVHLIMYKGAYIVGYAHIQLWSEHRAALRIIVIDQKERDKGLGQQFLAFIERWLITKDYKSIHTEASPKALSFYNKQGYTKMPFDDPDGYESDPQDISLGKRL